MQPAFAYWYLASTILAALVICDGQQCFTAWDPSESIWRDKALDLSFACPAVVTNPSDNRQVSFSGQRLATVFAFWRSNQRVQSPLPVALVISVYSASCPFSKAVTELVDEVALQYSKQSIKFMKVDRAQLSYSELIKMGVTSVPVIRVHSQAKRITYHGDRTLLALTEYITNHTGVATLPSRSKPSEAIRGLLYITSPDKVAIAQTEHMRALCTAPLTLLAEAITVAFFIEAIVKSRCWQPIYFRWQRTQHHES